MWLNFSYQERDVYTWETGVMQDSIGLKVNFHMIRAKYRSLRRYDAPSGRGTSVLTGLLGKVLRLGTMAGGFVLSWTQNEEEGMNERSRQGVLGVAEAELRRVWRRQSVAGPCVS